MTSKTRAGGATRGFTAPSTQLGGSFDDACRRWRDLYRRRAPEGHPERRRHRRISAQCRRQDPGQAAARRGRGADGPATVEKPRQLSVDFYSYRYFASRGLPARLQLPPAAAVRVDPRPAGLGRPTEDFVQRPGSSPSPSSGPRRSSTTKGSATWSTGSSCLSAGTPTATVCRPAREGSAARAVTFTRSAGAGPDVASAARDPARRAADATLLRTDKRLHPPPRPDLVRRRRTPAPGLRDPHDCPVHRDEGQAKRTGLATAQAASELLKLEFGQTATLWRVNIGWARRKDKDELRLRARPRARATGLTDEDCHS